MKLKTRLHKKILLSLNDINSCKVDHVPAVRSNVCNWGRVFYVAPVTESRGWHRRRRIAII